MDMDESDYNTKAVASVASVQRRPRFGFVDP